MEAQKLLEALKTVIDPDLQKDLVTLGMIHDLKIEPDVVSFRVVLTTPACPLKKQLEEACKNAITPYLDGRRVEIKMDAKVTPKKTAHTGNIPGVSHIIAVSSGKGGVGKSTVAVNLALSLMKQGASVGLMDADIYGPNIPTMLGVIDKPKLIEHPTRGELFVPAEAYGLKVMSMGFLLQQDQPVVWRGPMLHSIVQQFCHQVSWGQCDYLVIDMPPGTGDVQLSLAQIVPLTAAILVSTANEVSMQDVRKAFHMFEKVNVPVLGIVENMSTFLCDGCDKEHRLFGHEGGKKLAKSLHSELLAEIPLHKTVSYEQDLGKPVTLENTTHPVAIAFYHLSQRVAQKISMLAQKRENEVMVDIGAFN
jgi:ATP-binding protein involved in chromosome partitioning